MLSITVTSHLDIVDANDGVVSLREAIAQANSIIGADEIGFDAALAGKTVLLTGGELLITDTLTITGLGSGQLTIDASGSDPTPNTVQRDGSRIFNVDDGSAQSVFKFTLQDVSLRGGDTAGDGGAIRSLEELTVSNAILSANAAGGFGGAVYSTNKVSLANCLLTDNRSLKRGGAFYNANGVVLIEDCEIKGNTSVSDGGGIYTTVSTLVVIDTVVANNTGFSGGGLGGNAGSVKIEGSTINGNKSTSSFTDGGGGGVYVAFGNLSVQNSTISSNSSQRNGGGIVSSNGAIDIQSSTITGNTARGNGGGIYRNGSRYFGDLYVSESTISANSAEGYGGGIFGRTTTLTANTISGNSANAGGGVFSDRLTIADSTLSSNSAKTRGGGILAGQLTLANSTLSGNAATDGGGAIYHTQSSTIAYSVIRENTASKGGGIFAKSGATSVTNSTFEKNQAISGSGGIGSGGAFYGTSVGSSFVRTKLSGNVAISGGAVYARNSPVSFASCSIVDNTATLGDGGGILGGAVVIEECTIARNIARGNGGGVFSFSRFDISDSVIADNSANYEGGGAFGYWGKFSVSGSVISGNSAGKGGGGLFGGGDISVFFSTFSRNSAKDGAGIFLEGNIKVESSTISGNVATNQGGGVAINRYLSDRATATISNTTISGNEAGIDGGGIHVSSISPSIFLVLQACTITENSASKAGGGLFLTRGTLPIHNTIVANNDANFGDDLTGLTGASFAPRFSLIGSNEQSGLTEAISLPDAQGNWIGNSQHPISPQLEPLSDKGGPTFIHAPEAGSLAIDKGDPAAIAGALGVPTFDQRGTPFSRVYNGRIDIGAYERQSLPIAKLVVDTLTDESDGNYGAGQLSLREAIGLANGSLDTADEIKFAPSLFASGPATILLTHGELRIVDSVSISGPGQALLQIDASGNDPTPWTNSGDGSRVLNIDDRDPRYFNVSIAGLTMRGGDATSSGGAIYSYENLTIADCSILDNSASRGGGIYSQGSTQLSIVRSTISGNSAVHGGGIWATGYSSAHGKIIDSTITDNHADDRGGGVFFGTVSNSEAFWQVANSTISGNVAGWQGGGIYLNTGWLNVVFSTITQNQALVGGGIATQSNNDRAYLNFSIVAGNTDPAGLPNDLAKSLMGRFALIGTRGSANLSQLQSSIIGTDQAPIDPMLGPLTNNGGPTKTHALLPGSPAIDVADSSHFEFLEGLSPFDQRGATFNRVYDADSPARIDMGAIEYQPNALSGDYNYDRVVDARDYLVWRKLLSSTNDLRADGDNDGVVGQGDYSVWRANFGASLPLPSESSPSADGAVTAAVTAPFGPQVVPADEEIELLSLEQFDLNEAFTPLLLRTHSPRSRTLHSTVNLGHPDDALLTAICCLQPRGLSSCSSAQVKLQTVDDDDLVDQLLADEDFDFNYFEVF